MSRAPAYLVLAFLLTGTALAGPPGNNGVPPGLEKVCAQVAPDPEPEQIYVGARWSALATPPCDPVDCPIGRATVTLAAEGTFAVTGFVHDPELGDGPVVAAAFTWSEVAADADRELFIRTVDPDDARPIPGAGLARTVEILLTVEPLSDPRRRRLVLLAGDGGDFAEIAGWEVADKTAAALQSGAWAVVTTRSEDGTAFLVALPSDTGFDTVFAMTSWCVGPTKKGCYDAEGEAHGELSGY